MYDIFFNVIRKKILLDSSDIKVYNVRTSSLVPLNLLHPKLEISKFEWIIYLVKAMSDYNHYQRNPEKAHYWTLWLKNSYEEVWFIIYRVYKLYNTYLRIIYTVCTLYCTTFTEDVFYWLYTMFDTCQKKLCRCLF